VDRLRNLLGHDRDTGAGEAATAVSSALRVWRNEVVEEVAHVVAEALNVQAADNASLKEWLELRLNAQDAVLTEQNTVLAALSVELKGGRSDLNIGFETVVERQFVKERMIRNLTAQLQTLAAQMESARMHGEAPTPETVRDVYQKAIQLQEVVAAA
jgi:hypothetical protein